MSQNVQQVHRVRTLRLFVFFLHAYHVFLVTRILFVGVFFLSGGGVCVKGEDVAALFLVLLLFHVSYKVFENCFYHRCQITQVAAVGFPLNLAVNSVK